MNEYSKIVDTLLPHGPFDAVGIGIINFTKKCIEIKEIDHPYYDLASLTKPLTNSLSYFLKPEAFTPDMLLCLNHRGGLPAWGLLPNPGWKEQILKYPIKESETLYSDFSALRVMLELEKKGIDQKELCKKVWDKETVFWTDLPPDAKTLHTGFKKGEPNFGAVHDPNAWTIEEFCSHAGVYSTVNGLCQTLLNYEAETGFIQKVKKDLSLHSHRFALGWDRVINPNESLAGKGCGPNTFGHLGFTGTSIWIDPDRNLGHVILTNATKYHWFDKQVLNELRRAIGELVWSK
ncbi:MAG TPA: serine hydrolase [Bacteriovoracaceae bacterium]|nr:serine hydrolase [Bacteriovoracaceae bacterium]